MIPAESHSVLNSLDQRSAFRVVSDQARDLQEPESLDAEMPVIWDDTQGVSLVKNLHAQIAGVKAFHSGWPVRLGGKWLRGSAINIYGATNEMIRRAIIAILKNHMTIAGFAPIKICFYRELYGSRAQTAIESTYLGLD